MTDLDGTHVDGEDLENPRPLNVNDSEPSLKPTHKWWALFAGTAASIAASWILTGSFDDVERGMVATALTGLVAAYFYPNLPTPGGVPEK